MNRQSTAASIPRPAFVLGVAGLIPFLVGAAGLWVGPVGWRSAVMHLLLAYGAVVLTFVGAVHWGLALRDADADDAMLWRRLGASVVPALIGWWSFMLTPIGAFIIIALAFLAQYSVDRVAVQSGWAPVWYLNLRLGLTAVVTASLIVALVSL
ncbi:MAG: DUF3429 domain-containing protein, partial [Acidiferrobacterales bacterium]